MSKGLVTIFGGSGFVGRYAAHALVREGWRVRVAVRKPHLAGDVKLAGPPGWVDLAQANIRNKMSVERAVKDADVVINLVGILLEKGPQSFDGTQREGAINVAEAAAKAGVKRFVQISAIGADPDANSDYARTKAEAEEGVREVFPEAVILRPSVVFGPEDDFLNKFAGMASSPISNVLPFLPAIGGGKTKLQPVYAGDVADAIAAAATRDDVEGKTYELGGPRVYTFKELYEIIFETIDRKRFSLPLPFFIAKPLGLTLGAIWSVPPVSFGFFGPAPITGDQVEMLKVDNVVADDALTLADLGVTDIESVEAIAPSYLWPYRAYGEFHQKGDA